MIVLVSCSNAMNVHDFSLKQLLISNLKWHKWQMKLDDMENCRQKYMQNNKKIYHILEDNMQSSDSQEILAGHYNHGYTCNYDNYVAKF